MNYNPDFKSPCYSVSLCRASNLINAYYDQRMTPLGISIKQYSLLINIQALGSASTSELAKTVQLDRTTITRNLKSLLENQWIYDASKAGSRAHRYVLTEAGEEKLLLTQPVWQEIQKDIKNFLGDTEAAALMKALRHIQALPLT